MLLMKSITKSEEDFKMVTGSQEVTSSILVSSTNKIKDLQKSITQKADGQIEKCVITV